MFSPNRDKVVFQGADDEAILVNTETTYYYGLNGTGTFIWNFLNQQDATFEQIVDAVSAEYDVEPNAIRDDIAQLLQDLMQEQLILER